MKAHLFLLVSFSLVSVAHATSDYRPRTKKIEITAETAVITILFSDATPADVRLEAVFAGVRYVVPVAEGRILKGRNFRDPELRILPGDARPEGPKASSLLIVVRIPKDLRSGEDIYFSFLGDGIFRHTTIVDYDESGSRARARGESQKPSQPPAPTR